MRKLFSLLQDNISRKFRKKRYKVLLFAILVLLCFIIYWSLSEPKDIIDFWERLSFSLIPNLLGGLVIYYVLQEEIKKFHGIVEANERPTASYLNSIGNQKETRDQVMIIDTFLSDIIMNDEDSFKKNFINALERGVEIRILLFHPDSNSAQQRALDLSDSYKDLNYNIRASLFFLYEFLEEAKKYSKLEIKLYDAIPPFSLYARDTIGYTNTFPTNRLSDKSSVLVLELTSTYGKYLTNHFDVIWKNEVRTVFLQEFIKLELFLPNEKNAYLTYYAKEDNIFWIPIIRGFDASIENKLKQAAENNDEIQLKLEGRYYKGKADYVSEKDDFWTEGLGAINSYYSWDKPKSKKELNDSPNFLKITTHKLIHNSNNVLTEMVSDKYSFLSGDEFEYYRYLASARRELKQSWENLPIDKNMDLCGGGEYRKRRYGRFKLTNKGENLIILDNEPFKLSEAHYLFGGIERRFDPMEYRIQRNNFLKELILFDFNSVIPENLKDIDWFVQVHQIRILVRKDIEEIGLPTPEGIHTDGHRYLAIHLIDRENIEGGLSKIYEINELSENERKKLKREEIEDKANLLYSKTLTKPLDTIYINDIDLYHSVTDIRLSDKSKNFGYRDVLIIDFDFFSNINP